MSLRKIITRALVRDRRKARARLANKPKGTFGTDRFYGKSKKTVKDGAVAAAGGVTAGAGALAVSDKTKAKARETKNPALIKAAESKSATNKGIKKLIKREKKEQSYDSKRKSQSDAVWAKTEEKKAQGDIRPQVGGGRSPQDVRRGKQAKERKRAIKSSDYAQKEIKDFVEGKKTADWDSKNWGALTGSQKRKIKRLTKDGETPQQALGRLSKSEKKRKSTKISNQTLRTEDAEYEKLRKQNPSWSKVYTKSIAKKNVQYSKRPSEPAPIKKVRKVGSTQGMRSEINVKAGRPAEGTKRMKARDRIGDKHKFDPTKKTRNTKRIKNEDGEIVTPKSNVKGSAKQEAHISGQAAKSKKLAKAQKLLKNKNKNILDKYDSSDPNAEVSPEDLKKIARSIGSKIQKKDDPKVWLSSDENNMELNEKIGALAGAAVGSELTRRYLRDVKLRHKQFKKKKNKWRSGKAPIFGNKAPQGFRGHVGTRALARLLTPIAIGGSIGYGIKRKKEHSN